MYTPIQICIMLFVYIYVNCVCVYIYTHIHPSIHPSIHTYIHTYMHRQRVVRHGTAYMVLHGTQLSAGLALAALKVWAPGWSYSIAYYIIV